MDRGYSDGILLVNLVVWGTRLTNEFNRYFGVVQGRSFCGFVNACLGGGKCMNGRFVRFGVWGLEFIYLGE